MEKEKEAVRPMFRTFELVTNNAVPEIDAIGIGLMLLSEMPPDGKRRVAAYWASFAEQQAALAKATPSSPANDKGE